MQFVWMRKMVLALKKEHKSRILKEDKLNYVAVRSGRLEKNNFQRI
jgi:hypothetical protein